jgi:hypothetical protein
LHDPDLKRVEIRRWAPCIKCGETHDTKYRYLYCFACMKAGAAERAAKRAPGNPAFAAILAVEARKAEIKAAARTRK